MKTRKTIKTLFAVCFLTLAGTSPVQAGGDGSGHLGEGVPAPQSDTRDTTANKISKHLNEIKMEHRINSDKKAHLGGDSIGPKGE